MIDIDVTHYTYHVSHYYRNTWDVHLTFRYNVQHPTVTACGILWSFRVQNVLRYYAFHRLQVAMKLRDLRATYILSGFTIVPCIIQK